MSEDIVKIKGTKGGLLLSFKQGADFSAIEANIREKLEKDGSFFPRGTAVEVAPDALKKDDRDRLQRIFFDHGILFRLTDPSETKPKQPTQQKKLPTSIEPLQEDIQEMLVVKRTVRGGEEIKSDGSILVCGNVNPSAQIIAGGSIDIRGVCRGMVHAGAFGNSKAVIIADKLMPMQIRIANLVARPPESEEEPEKTERASVKDGQIIIEAIER